MKLKITIAIALVVVVISGCLLAYVLSDNTPEETTPTVALCLRKEADPVWQSYHTQLKQQLEQAGYSVKLMDAANDQFRQEQQIHSLLEEGYRLFVVEPVDMQAAEHLAQKLQSQEALAVFFGTVPEQRSATVSGICFFGCKMYASGIAQGEVLLNTPNQGDFNGDGTISYVVLQGKADAPETLDRTQHCDDALVSAGFLAERLELYEGDWSENFGNQAGIESLSKLGRDIEVIFCTNDVIAAGALKAIEAGGRTVGENIYLIGADATSQSLQLVASGKLTGTVYCDYGRLARQTVEILETLAAGEETEPVTVFELTAVDIQNVADIGE